MSSESGPRAQRALWELRFGPQGSGEPTERFSVRGRRSDVLGKPFNLYGGDQQRPPGWVGSSLGERMVVIVWTEVADFGDI